MTMESIKVIRDAIRFLRGGYEDQSTSHLAFKHEQAPLGQLKAIEKELHDRDNRIAVLESQLQEAEMSCGHEAP